MIKIAAMVGAPDLETRAVAPYQGDLQPAFYRLAEMGYEGIELMTKNPSKLDGKAIHNWLCEQNLRMVALCTGHVYGEDQLGLVAQDLQISQAAMERLQQFVDFGANYFGEGTLVTIGRSRGWGDPSQPQATWEVGVKAFQQLADYAAPHGIRIALEPICSHEHWFIQTTQEGIRICHAVGRPNFGLMLDTYHMNIQDDDLLASLREAQSYCWHMHFSDQNRMWPGSGVLDFGKILSTLQEIDYKGFVSMEILPQPDPDTSARASIEWVRQYL
jgi:sugar phosphate isomerase/epimerase